MDKPIVSRTGLVPYGFLLALALVVGLQLLASDGAARSGLAFIVYVAITVAIVAGVLMHSPEHRAPWVLLAVTMAFFAVDMFGWVLETTEWAVELGEFLQDAFRLLAVVALAGTVAVFMRVRRQGSPPSLISDGMLIAAGGALMVWQWFVLVEGLAESSSFARVGVPLVLAGLTATMTLAASRILGVTLIGSQTMLFLLGGAVMALAAQAALTLTDSGTGPARWTDVTWLIAGVLVGAGALHPTMAQPAVWRQAQSRQATRLLMVGTVLLVNPAIVWLHLLQPTSDRRVVWAIAAAVAVVTVLGVWRVGHFVADLGAMRTAVARSEVRFSSLVRHASDVIMVIDSDYVVSYASPSAEKVLGRSPSDLIGTPLADLVSAADSAGFIHFLAEAARHRASSLSAEVVMHHRSGEERSTEIVTVNLEDEEGVDGIVVTIRDVTERAKAQAELKHLATHDALTGLANREVFSDRVSHALERSARLHTLVGVVFVDLDDFKTVNDSLGHLAGDEVLRTVADRLSESLRTADTAARLGGDEFAILLEDLDEPADAIPIVERMAATLQQQMMIEDRQVHLGATMGVALGRAAGSAEELLRNADTAMFNAKSAGKSRYHVFEPAMHRAAMFRLDLKEDLRRALDGGQFTLHYQPIYSLGEGRIQGVEALLRWHHPSRGTVFPHDFIPLMEETGQIVTVGRWVLREALTQARRWKRESGSLWMSVNLSVRQLHQPDLVADVRQALEDTGVRPSDVVMEITESVFMEDTDAAVFQLDRLKQLGVRLAIDDFGTGYSALSYLQRFRADIIKVDKSFVHALGDRSDHHTLTKGIIAMARELGMVTVAEGVEDADQVVDLRAIQCDFAQGYHLALPQSAADLDKHLEADEQHALLVQPTGQVSFTSMGSAQLPAQPDSPS